MALPFFDLVMPFIEALFEGGDILLFEKGKDFGKNPFAVAHDGKIDPHILADGSGIDIDMDDLCVGSKGLDLPGHPIIKTSSDGDEEIGFHHGHIGPIGSVHSQHSQEREDDCPESHPDPSGSWSQGCPVSRQKG